MKQRTRVAVVGAGYFSEFHLAGWRAQPDAEIVALYDSNQPRAESMAARFGIPRRCASLDELLDGCNAELVDVVTPPGSHAEILGAARARGLPTICQKPFATDYRQARSLADMWADSSAPLVVHENFRFMPWYREARRMISAGLLGQLHGVSFRLRPGDGQGPEAYLDRQPYFQRMPRLLVAETAIHFIDTFRFLLDDEVQAVSARLRRLNPAIAGEDAGLIILEFGGGATGLFDGNRLNDHVAQNPRRTMGEMWLEGSGGVLRLDGEARLWFKPHRGAETEHAFDAGSPSSFGGGACGALQRHVLDCLAEGRQPDNTAGQYLQNLKVQEAVYASHQTGRRIELHGFDPSAPLLPPNL